MYNTLSQTLSIRASSFLREDSVVRGALALMLFALVQYFGLEMLGGAPLVFFILGGSGSTPFLATWNGKKMKLENDFMFGEPRSFFRNVDEGKCLYEEGKITPDLLVLQNKTELKDGKFLAQIREIEPEESYLDHLSLIRAVHPKGSTIVADSRFHKFMAFENASLEKLEGVTNQTIHWSGKDVSVTAGNTKNLFQPAGRHEGYFIDAEKDVVEIKGRIVDPNKDAYLLIKANFRDWTAGEIFNDADSRLHAVGQNRIVSRVLSPLQKITDAAFYCAAVVLAFAKRATFSRV